MDQGPLDRSVAGLTGDRSSGLDHNGIIGIWILFKLTSFLFFYSVLLGSVKRPD